MTLSHGTIEQMRVRIGLKCGENDARYLFPDQNGAKALTMMKGPIGTAVMNLDYTEQSNIGKTDALPVRIHMGTLIKVVSPFVITVDNKRKHNLLICGSNEKMANTILQNYIVSALLHVNASVYCVDGDTLVGDDGLADFYNAVSAASPRFKATRNRGDIIHLINEVYQKYLAWKKRNCDEVVIEAVTPGTLVVGIDIAKEKQWARFVDCRGPDALLAGHLMERLGWTIPRKNAMMKKRTQTGKRGGLGWSK